MSKGFVRPRQLWAGVRPGPPSPLAPGGFGMPITAISEAYEYLVQSYANPFALRWVPALTRIGGEQAGTLTPLGRTIPAQAATSAIHPGDGGLRSSPAGPWHHISIAVVGEVIFPTGAPPPSVDTVAQSSAANRSTSLKARITLSMGTSRTRVFDIDIGAGVELDVRCRAVVSIEVLVPDPTSIPISPEPLGEGGLGFRNACALVTTVTCGVAPQGYRNPVTYTQSFLILGTDGSNALMPRMRDAIEIEIFGSSIGDFAGAQGQFVYVPSSPIDPVYDFMETPAEIGIINSDLGGGSTGRHVIPGSANAILLANATGGNATVTAVQILNV